MDAAASPDSKLFELVYNDCRQQYEEVCKDLTGLVTLSYKDLEIIYGHYHNTQCYLNRNPRWLIKSDLNADGIYLKFAVIQSLEQIMQLYQSIPSHQLELSFRHIHPSLAFPRLRDHNWDTWTLIGKNTSDKTLKLLLDACQPFLCSPSGEQVQAPMTITFLGCGDGREIEAFVERYGTAGYHLVGIDQSQRLIELARQRLGDTATLYHRDLNQLPEIVAPQSIDLFFVLGVFDAQTLDARQAVQISNNLQPCLKPGAIGFSASYGAHLLAGVDYRNLGYDVLSGVLKPRLFSNSYPDVYVIENSTRPSSSGYLPAQALYQEAMAWHRYPDLLKRLAPFAWNIPPAIHQWVCEDMSTDNQRQAYAS